MGWPGPMYDNYENRMRNARTRAERMEAARKKGRHTRLQWEALKKAIGKACVRCGTTKYNLERDHITPISKGGCDCIGNLQPICARCNSSKGPEDIDFRHKARPDWVARYEQIMAVFEDE